MQKILLFISFLCFSSKIFSQTLPAKSGIDTDSSEILKDLMNLLGNDDKPSSYFTIGVGIGNRVFNVQNNVLNSKVTPENTVIWSPSLLYHHKTGLYISAGGNLLNDTKKGFVINEYSLAGGYELALNDNADFTVAYSHIFVSDFFSQYASPVHNDLYAAYSYKKTWIKPGLTVDFSSGEYGDVKTVRLLYDSIGSKLTSFSLVPSISHEFDWEKVFNDKDEIVVTPSLMLNMSKSRQRLRHNTNAVNLAAFLNKKGRLPKLENTKFEAQSVALGLDANYAIGKLSFDPQAYFDYYLPSTTDNRLLSYFTFAIRYSFQ